MVCADVRRFFPADPILSIAGVRILSYTSLYPDSARPGHGVFVENRLRHLVGSGEVELRVVAPVPWFPSANPAFGQYAGFAKVPKREVRHGIDVIHPRYPLLPKIGMTVAPLLMAASTLSAVRGVIREGYDFDVLDAHYFYPDGVAAAMIGRLLDKPVVITARGTDLNLIPRYRMPRAMIRWAARQAAGLITVCRALKDVLVEFGIDESRVCVLRNGVDLSLFLPPADRDKLREDLGLHGPVILSVGYLIPRKGHDLVIRAAAAIPELQVLIAGTGEEETKLRNLVSELRLGDRVRFLGAVPHEDLARYYGAADALVLASSREGWANVLLEAMACGTPVVATPVWGTPEVVSTPEAGILARERSVDALTDAIRALLANYPDRSATRRYAERFSWDDTTRGQLELFQSIQESVGTRN